jgi:electron transport complex protein RnfB
LKRKAVLIAEIDAALPQTQCTRCGYPDCHAYAVAVAEGAAAINQCPPGGAEGIMRLAAITGQPALPLSAAHGIEAPRALAVIDEAWCIGCTLCIKACPVDAIVGAAKQMHLIVNEQCTGCELCVPACPVDCISMIGVTEARSGWAAWSEPQAEQARHRYGAHQARLQRRSPKPAAAPPPSNEPDRKQAMIAAALARARSQRSD